MSPNHEFRRLCSFEGMKSIAETLCRKAVAGIDGVTGWKFLKQGLDLHVQQILESLVRGGHRFSHYREKLILKGRRPPRVISIPTVRDSIVLKVLMRTLTDAFPESAPPAPFKMVNRAVRIFKEGKFNAYIRIDIKDFYPSIVHATLHDMLKQKIRDGKILRLVMQAIKTPTVPMGKKAAASPSEKGVPQGLSISNILSNIYMLEFDRMWENRKDCAYVRYVDDILIFCRGGREDEILRKIQEFARQFELEIHPLGSGKTEKGKIVPGMKEEISYLGYTFRIAKSDKIVVGVRAEAMRKIRKSIIDILTIYRHSPKKNDKHLEWCLNLRITGCRFDERWFGWVHYYSQADIAVAWTLDEFVKKAVSDPRFGAPAGMSERIMKFTRSMRMGRMGGSPDFDNWPVEKMKGLLENVFGFSGKKLAKASEDEIRQWFRARVFRHVRQLQRDMNPESGDDGGGRSGG